MKRNNGIGESYCHSRADHQVVRYSYGKMKHLSNLGDLYVGI